MRKTNVTPLAKGLIGSKAKTISGQMEVTYHNYKAIHIAIWRKMYSGLPNIKFSIADTDLPDMIEILIQAQKKIENHWLSSLKVCYRR